MTESRLSLLREDARGSGRQGELLEQRWPGYKLTELAFKVVASLCMRASLERHNRKESIDGGECRGSNRWGQEKGSSDSSCQQRRTLDSRRLLSSFAVLKALGWGRGVMTLAAAEFIPSWIIVTFGEEMLFLGAESVFGSRWYIYLTF